MSFNPSKEMTAVPPEGLFNEDPTPTPFQPLKGNDSRAASDLSQKYLCRRQFQPLKGNDSRAAA